MPGFLYTLKRRGAITGQAAFKDVEKAMTGRSDHQTAWKVDGNHVYPVNDLREHSVTDCWCRPADDDGIVVHNSLDGRELYEQGARKLS